MDPLITADDIALFREQALAEMDDVCKITVPGIGKGPFNETTGQYDTPARVVIYGPGATDAAYEAGTCRFQIKADINSNIVETTAGENEWTYTTSQLQLPVSALYIPVDAIVEAVSSRFNPALPGRLFNVHGEISPKSKPVIRRLRLREVVAA